MPKIRNQNIIALYGLLQCLFVPIASANWLEDFDEYLENFRLGLLAQVQANTNNQLAPFTTDGCSGGLSVGWKLLANSFEAFNERYGDKPPWEYCCVAHDKAYWRGPAENGYQLRKLADQELRQCVWDLGKKLNHQYAVEFNKTPQEVTKTFTLIGNLMYNAVRLGGKPCSAFNWRWGYGWPPCDWTGEQFE